MNMQAANCYRLAAFISGFRIGQESLRQAETRPILWQKGVVSLVVMTDWVRPVQGSLRVDGWSYRRRRSVCVARKEVNLPKDR